MSSQKQLLSALRSGQKLSGRLFTALGILLEAQRVRYQSPSSVAQRNELRAAGKELAAALTDWRTFVDALGRVVDSVKFQESELSVISRVNQLLLDSVERLGGGSGKVLLLVFIAVWKTTYVVLRTAIQLLVSALRAVSSLGLDLSQVVSDYLHAKISGFGSSAQSSGFFGSKDAPPSIRKTVLYLLSGALLVGIPIAILTHYVLPAFMTVLTWMWRSATVVAKL